MNELLRQMLFRFTANNYFTPFSQGFLKNFELTVHFRGQPWAEFQSNSWFASRQLRFSTKNFTVWQEKKLGWISGRVLKWRWIPLPCRPWAVIIIFRTRSRLYPAPAWDFRRFRTTDPPWASSILAPVSFPTEGSHFVVDWLIDWISFKETFPNFFLSAKFSF